MLFAKQRDTEQNSKHWSRASDFPMVQECELQSRQLLTDEHDIPVFFELLQRARDGDDDAACKMLEKYRNYLLAIAHADTDSWLKEKIGPSDLVQASLISGYENFSQFRGESEAELTAWLKMILKNGVRKGKRRFSTSKRNVHRETSFDANPSQNRQIVDPKQTPQSKAMANEKTRSVQKGLDNLSPAQREIIELRNFEQLGFAEIGKRTNRSPDAARKFWARTIETLKAHIKSVAPELLDESCNLTNKDD